MYRQDSNRFLVGIGQLVLQQISLFNCLDSNEINVTFPLPNITAIQRGVLNKPSLERRIYLFGNSIMRQVSEELADLCEEESNGVSMTYQRLEVDTNIYLIDASSLKNSTKDDILILHHLGNSLLMKDKFFKDQGCYHFVNPRIPEDDEMSLIVAKLTKLLRLKFGNTSFKTCCSSVLYYLVDGN